MTSPIGSPARELDVAPVLAVVGVAGGRLRRLSPGWPLRKAIWVSHCRALGPPETAAAFTRALLDPGRRPAESRCSKGS